MKSAPQYSSMASQTWRVMGGAHVRWQLTTAWASMPGRSTLCLQCLPCGTAALLTGGPLGNFSLNVSCLEASAGMFTSGNKACAVAC